MCERWMPCPAPEPVAALVQPSAALAPAHSLRIPHLAPESEPASIPDLAVFAQAPGAEPVAAFVQAVAALNPAPVASTMRLELEMGLSPVLDARPEPGSLRIPAEATAIACAATTEVPEPAYTQSVEQTGTVPCMPAAQFTADLEPLPTADELFEPPEMCQQWMPAPPADAVFSYLQVSNAPAVTWPTALIAPAFAPPASAPFVPWIPWSRSLPEAEAVVVPIRPSAKKTPLELLRQEAVIALPALSQVAHEVFAAEKSAASAPAPEAVESLLLAAHASMLVSIKHAPSRSAQFGAPPAVFEVGPVIGKPAAGPAPAPLESLLVASVAAVMAPEIAVRTLPFAMTAGQERTVPSFNALGLAPEARRSGATASRVAEPQPIATLAVVPPDRMQRPLESALPRPGLVPVEFHTHSLRSGPVARPEWEQGRPSLVPPKFRMGLVPEKLEDPNAQQKPVRKEPEVVKILNMPAAKRPPTVLMVFGRVAAGFLLVASLWYGLTNVRGNRQLALREVSDGAPAISAANSAAPGKAPNGGAPVRPAAKGTGAWVRKVIADRAALQVSENFRGMEGWDSDGQNKPAGWSRHPDGYMQTGALALFRPTLKFDDYRMEFFGQIESKSIGWTVRATDAKNYHAMKLTVIEAGLRPFVALVQYNVVNGKSGHRTQTPLNVMVHNNRPLQFAVDVRGNRFVTSINGEEVDSFIDNTRASGGVGFFSEAGERARLYWMKVSRNDDWLGRMCAFLSGNSVEESTETAWLERTLPGDNRPTPMPARNAPENWEAVLAADAGEQSFAGAPRGRAANNGRVRLWSS
jgi:hypothetical protein